MYYNTALPVTPRYYISIICDAIQTLRKFLGQLIRVSDLPIRRSSNHLTPCWPLATSEKPIVAPTMQCVPEMGSLRKEAASCHTAEPNENK